jgi:hypothetical protein
MAGSTEKIREIAKAYTLSEPKGPRIPFTVECWPFSRWKISETAKSDRIFDDFQYEWEGRRTRLCRLTPTTPLKPSTQYRLTGVGDSHAPAADDGSTKPKRASARFTTTAAAETVPPDASRPATATPFYFRVNAPGVESNGRNVDRDARGIVLKIRLPRFEGHGAPPLFAVWFGKAEGPAIWLVSGSDTSVGLGLPDLCGDDRRVPQTLATVTIRPLDAAGNLGQPIEIAVSTRKPLKIFDQW